MKKILFIVMVLGFYCCNAQNYDCFQSNTQHFFLNGNGYLRGIRIDSVREDNYGDTIYYPYHTQRASVCCSFIFPSMDSSGGSWLGKKVIKQTDGTFLFDDIWQDTIVIKTLAQPGDSWTFFSDTTQKSYKAIVTSKDTMTILGAIDSVKKITLEADSAGTVNISDPLNNFQIILSKDHGFAQIFDVYTFPYRLSVNQNPDNFFIDYYLNLALDNVTYDTTTIYTWMPGARKLPDANNSIFHLLAFYNPSYMDVYNFALGDIYEVEAGENYPQAIMDEYLSATVVSKISNQYSVSYTWSESWKATQSTPNGNSNTSLFYYINTGPFDTSRIFDFTKLPEEWGPNYVFYYYPSAVNISSPGSQCANSNYVYCKSSSYNNSYPGFVTDDGGIQYLLDFTSYGIGYGQTASSTTQYFGNPFDPDGSGTINSSTEQYIYTKKGDSSCGGYVPLSVPTLSAVDNKIELYPNPAQNSLTISSSSGITEVIISNLLGQTVFSRHYNDEQVQVDLSQLPSGVYTAKINGTQIKKFVKE
jgi:hypothetical protein